LGWVFFRAGRFTGRHAGLIQTFGFEKGSWRFIDDLVGHARFLSLCPRSMQSQNRLNLSWLTKLSAPVTLSG
jgi:hypothetical protein